MKITKIKVKQHITWGINPEINPFSNLNPLVELEAEISEGDDIREAHATLSEMAREMVFADLKQQILKLNKKRG